MTPVFFGSARPQEFSASAICSIRSPQWRPAARAQQAAEQNGW